MAMILIAVVFIVYALNNPQASFPWGNNISYIIYITYAIVTTVCLLLALRKK